MSNQTVTVVTPAETSPVSLAQFKEHARINSGDDDTTAQIYLDAAVQSLTEWTGYTPEETVYRVDVDEPTGYGGLVCVTLPRYPVTSIGLVEKRNADGTYATITSTYYRLTHGRHLWVDASALAISDGIFPTGLRATFTAEGGSTANVKVAVLQLAAQHYQHREATTDLRLSDVPYALKVILEGLKGGEI